MVSEINGNLSAWELIGSSMGTTQVNFEANKYTEIVCVCVMPSSGCSDIYQIPTIALKSTETIFSHGYAGGSNGMFFIDVAVTNSSVKIRRAETNGANVTNKAAFSVYGR